MSSFVKLLVASLKEFGRDRTTLSFTIILPLLLVAFFGLALNGGSQKLTIGISKLGWTTPPMATFSLQETMLADVAGLQQNQNVHTESGSPSTEMARLRDGTVDAVLAYSPGHIRLYFDKSNGATSLAIQSLDRSLTTGIGSPNRATPPIVLDPVRGLANSRLDFVIPGILATAIMWLGIFAAIPLVQQREQQILRRFAVTPVPRSRVVLAQVASRLAVGLAQAVVILAAARLVFGVPIGARFGSGIGSLVLVAALVLLGALAFVSIGYAVAALSATQSSAHAWAQILTMPMLVLAGVFFPVSLMPAVLQPVVAVLPLTYLADALRQVTMNGQYFAPFGVDLAVLAAWIVGALAVSVRFFRWS